VWVRYGRWLDQVVVHHSLGRSLVGNESVGSVIGARFPLTFELAAYAFLLALVFSVPTAVLAARRPGGIGDRVSMMISMAGLSVAPFVLALVLILVLSVQLRVFPAIYPTSGRGVFGTLYNLFMPALAFAFPLFCFFTRFLRAEILDQMMREDYIVAARAKGVSESRLLVRHAMRNSLFGFLTVVGVNVGTLIAGTVVVEAIFSIPGLGQELLTAISDRDLPVVQGIVLIYACFAVFANLLTDVLYGLVDPRIRYGRSTV
jgi:peptide/nickel transport system permease protein